MEVEMGRSFLLADSNHQHGTDFPVLKAVKYKEERTSDALISKSVSGKENYSEMRSPTGKEPSVSEQGPGKALIIFQNGVPHGNKQVEQNLPKTAEATRDKSNIQSSEKPKMQSILRRTCSSTDTEERNSSETPKTPYEKGEQDSGGERELSWGRRAWEITQRRKAQMREEFFKVPYEECNREAARSLGGRLNKSEPRLHTLGKERKKRNSLSYKRRVHFDLDHCEDEDDRKSRCRSKSFEAPDPPKKVVVSIYSIDEKMKSIIQPNALIHCNVAGGVSSQSAMQTTNTQSMNVRPTDLDSLQQILKNVANRQQRSHNADELDTKTDRQARREFPQRPAPPTTTMQPSNNHEETLVRNDSTTKSENQTAPLPDDSLFSSLSPLEESSVRSRRSPSLPLQGAPGNAATPTAIPCPLYVPSRISSPQLEQLESLSTTPPVPAPRSRLNKSHPLSGHSLPSQTAHLEGTQQTSSQPPHPRPDHLNLNAPTSAGTVMHVFTPAKTCMHPQRVSPAHTDLDKEAEPPVAAVEKICGTPSTIPTTDALLASATPIASTTPSTYTLPSIPSITRSLTSSRTAPHTPSTPDSHMHCATNSSSGPVPMPRKRISVSQQTPTPRSSPHHSHPLVTTTPTISTQNTFSTQASTSHHTHHNHSHHHHHHHNNNNNNAKKIPPNSVDSQTSKFKTANSGGTFTNNDPPNTRAFYRSTVYPEESNKENDAVRQNKKTTVTDRENCVNILMTKGESYAQHNIVISSHMSPAPPSVTVRKVFIPVSAPSRSSPSPTPSCASSSCSFSSSGSSSGCYSGSPSPTPTPSPTRIRASCVPTDL